MDEKRSRTVIEQTQDALTVRLGEGARLIRLGPSMVVVADPSDDDDELAALALTGGTTIMCICSGRGECKVSTKQPFPDTIEIACDTAKCDKGCTRHTVDRLWDSPFISRVMSEAFADPDDE